jgi:regulator of sirC expression with transglutaminase-like and TPR domain
MDVKKIRALVSLLDDEDLDIIQHVEEKILSLGDVIIPFLETEWETNFNQNVQKRIEDLIHHLQFTSLREKLIDWKENDKDNLLKGLWLVATYQYPDLDYKKIKKEMDKIYYEVWLNHRTYASPHDQIKNLNNIIFTKLNFSSNTQNMQNPSNSMINLVLESRRGNPIALCSVYMLVAQQLKIPIYGVNLPNLFILTYKSDEAHFYINAANKGLIFGKKDIDDYMEKLQLKPRPQFYEPCTNLEMVQRFLRNLILSFEQVQESEKVEEIKMLLVAISK